MSEGIWIPACPLPLYGFRKVRCECGDKFRAEADYERHWYETHAPIEPWQELSVMTGPLTSDDRRVEIMLRRWASECVLAS